MQAMSLFSGGGIGETYLEGLGIYTIIANELVKNRAAVYRYRFSNVDMVEGDIHDVKDKLIRKGMELRSRILIATPPCQGMSRLGMRKYQTDTRNFLIFDVFDIMDALSFVYLNSPRIPRLLSAAKAGG